MTRFTLVNPKDHGAKGDGTTDDAEALEKAFAAVPAGGGIVLFPAGTYLKDQSRVAVTKSHTLLWAPNRRATIHGTVRSLTEQERDDELCGVRQQALVFQRTVGGGIYGLRFTSNATERTSCAEDCQILLDTVDGIDIVGTEVDGASACGVFAWSSAAESRSQNLFVEGNFFHHTLCGFDSPHARRPPLLVLAELYFNAAPSLGDDGIACVTYSPEDPRCGEMKWWGNVYLGGAHGRGMAVIGGEDISIHHNWIIGAAAAGLIVASESAYTSASSERIELRSNYIVDSPNGSVDNGHSSILISGGNAQAEPIRAVESVANVIVGAPENRVERAEGRYDAGTVRFDDTTDPMALPGPVPTLDDVRIEDTSIVRTREFPSSKRARARGFSEFTCGKPCPGQASKNASNTWSAALRPRSRPGSTQRAIRASTSRKPGPPAISRSRSCCPRRPSRSPPNSPLSASRPCARVIAAARSPGSGSESIAATTDAALPPSSGRTRIALRFRRRYLGNNRAHASGSRLSGRRC